MAADGGSGGSLATCVRKAATLQHAWGWSSLVLPELNLAGCKGKLIELESEFQPMDRRRY